MNSYSLPQELIDRILDFLHSDRKSLSQCRAVCKCWLPCASHHLFHRLTIVSSLDLSRSTVVPYVRSLCIKDTVRVHDLRLPGLSRLIGLRELLLEHFMWNHLSNDAQCDLSELLPRLVALELRKGVFPTLEVMRNFILAAKSLQRLCIDSGVWINYPIPPTSPSSCDFFAQLQHLSLPADMYSGTALIASAQKYIAQYIPATLTLLETKLNQVAVELLRRIGPSLQHLKLICTTEKGKVSVKTLRHRNSTADIVFSTEDTQEFLGGGALAANIDLRTVTFQLMGGSIDNDVISILCTILSPSLDVVVIMGSGELSIGRSSERDLELLAAKFMDSSLAIGDPKVKLRILYSYPRINVKMKAIYYKYQREFLSLDRLGRLEVKGIPEGLTNNYSPFEIFKGDIHLGWHNGTR